MSSHVIVMEEVVEDSGHDKVGDSTAGVTKATGECICGTNNVLVEESCGPYLTRDKGATKDADEKSKNNKSSGIVNSECQCCWDGTCEQTSSKHQSWAET